MSLVATPGASNADSYVTLSEATTYFQNTFGKSATWAAIQSSDQEILLREAARLLDRYFDWVGELKQESVQSMRWPRYRAYDMDRRLIGEDVVPNAVKDAQCELAYYVAEKSGIDFTENTLDRIKVGPILIDFSKTIMDQPFPKIVTDMLGPLGSPIAVSANQVKQVRLVRT